jgi:hypothetical protein
MKREMQFGTLFQLELARSFGAMLGRHSLSHQNPRLPTISASPLLIFLTRQKVSVYRYTAKPLRCGGKALPARKAHSFPGKALSAPAARPIYRPMSHCIAP